ncbi:MAG: lytic transglycosylase domain-containing protein, partial [Desulfobacca sp.]|uniref:lytic transglycosylase domain-containing protein n=1 Tax=Desulfobacca sp. TaxID=2067990 RepID=UPI00404A5A5F
FVLFQKNCAKRGKLKGIVKKTDHTLYLADLRGEAAISPIPPSQTSSREGLGKPEQGALMKEFAILLMVLVWLASGCGGGKQVAQDPGNTLPGKAEDQLAMDWENEKDEPLVGSISSQRLEELYGKTHIPSLDEALDQEMKKWELQKTFDMPIQVNKEVRNYIYYFSTDRKEIFGRYLSRSNRYLPMIKKIFAQYGLPEDLAYLAMIESGYNNNARSTANAVGMWQFIKGTGLRYGLTINDEIDERRDPEKATHAAAKYLLDLYKQFGSWYLAAASYNCGEGRVQREINKNGNMKSFWDLSSNYSLPTETKNYVPQMIAATIIAKNPEKYGFKRIPYQPPLKYEVVKVTEPTTLQAAAVAATTSFEEISALNPELLRKTTPLGYTAYLLKIPPGKKEAFERNILLARAQFPLGRNVYYASRQTLGDASVYSAAAPQARRYQQQVQTAAVVASSRQRRTAASRSVAAAKTSNQTALREKTRKYDDLPKLVKQRESSRATAVSRIANLKDAKEKKEIVVAYNAVRSSKETATPTAKKPVRRPDKAAAEPMTAGMLGSLGTPKKAKKEPGPAVAKKTEDASKGKKKK